MIRELWSTEDDAQCERMQLAVEEGDLAGLLFAIEGAEQEKQLAARGWFAKWAERCVLLSELPHSGSSARVLARVLVEEMSFRGDACHYYAPRNSHLSEVVVRRRGLPILLSSLWCIIGEEAGFSCTGVALPGHYIARVDGVLVDPFDGGRALDVASCRRLVGRIAGPDLPWQDSWLDGAGIRDTGERVLRNLVGSYLREGDACRIYRTLRQLTVLCPDAPDYLLNRGRLARSFALHGEARSLFEEAERMAPTASLRAEARAALNALARESSLVN